MLQKIMKKNTFALLCYIYKKKSTYKWTHAIQTHVVQEFSQLWFLGNILQSSLTSALQWKYESLICSFYFIYAHSHIKGSKKIWVTFKKILIKSKILLFQYVINRKDLARCFTFFFVVIPKSGVHLIPESTMHISTWTVIFYEKYLLCTWILQNLVKGDFI